MNIIKSIFNPGVSTSGKFSFNITDAKKIGRDALLVGVSASLVFLLNYVGTVDLGVYTPLLVPAISSVLNAALKWSKDNVGK